MLGALTSCTLQRTLSLLLGHVILVSERLRLKALKKLTWPNERGSVGRRVQKASAPSTALSKISIRNHGSDGVAKIHYHYEKPYFNL
ncbi:hypothetical protein SLEP1_g54286 [Rubroshorea leprosula]|uniref:Secreted protein n=1 Tax=Rubroshorea leprosula TaxID=152421 RepID=A0AAV5MEW0_9ROSI|nr:hypothetical protein SLEP1_g54286 [Rubroshorea leprosula]